MNITKKELEESIKYRYVYYSCVHGGSYEANKSLLKKLSPNLIKVIRQITGVQEKLVLAPWVQQQTDGVSCGFQAVANITAVVLGENPSLHNFNVEKMRPTLRDFLLNEQQVSLFPRSRGIKPQSQIARTFEIK